MLKQQESYTLLYHSFSDLHRRYYLNVTHYQKFLEDILKLSNAFSFSAINDISSSSSIALTFDDGFRAILPMIDFCHRNNIPTTIFVPSAICEGETLLPKDKIIAVCRALPRGTRVQFLDFSLTLHNSSLLFRDFLGARLNRYAMQQLSYEKYNEYIQHFFETYHRYLSAIDDDLSLLTAQELKKIAEQYPSCTIGFHGHMHYNMTRLTPIELRQELTRGKELLEELIGRPVQVLSYPYGAYNQEVERMAQEVGYTQAITIEETPWRQNASPFSLPRITIDNRTVEIV